MERGRRPHLPFAPSAKQGEKIRSWPSKDGPQTGGPSLLNPEMRVLGQHAPEIRITGGCSRAKQLKGWHRGKSKSTGRHRASPLSVPHFISAMNQEAFISQDARQLQRLTCRLPGGALLPLDPATEKGRRIRMCNLRSLRSQLGQGHTVRVTWCPLWRPGARCGNDRRRWGTCASAGR